MIRHDIGSLVVKEGDKMVSLLTDHHIARNLRKTNCSSATSRIGQRMKHNRHDRLPAP